MVKIYYYSVSDKAKKKKRKADRSGQEKDKKRNDKSLVNYTLSGVKVSCRRCYHEFLRTICDRVGGHAEQCRPDSDAAERCCHGFALVLLLL